MKKSQKGFTLLELLLVVGIAAVLIVAGITTYSMVSKSNQVTEAVRLTNLLLEQVRRINAGQSTYAIATNFETALINTGNVPQKYVSGTNIITPSYTPATPANAVVITGSGVSTFALTMQAGGRTIPEIAANFDPRQSDLITQIVACGITIQDNTNAATLFTPAAMAGGAGCVNDDPANYVITSR